MRAPLPIEQREALDAQLLARLDGLGDVVTAFKTGNLEYAERLSREHADELHVLARLREMDERSELEGEREIVRSVMERLRAIAEGDTTGLAGELAELHKFTDRNRLVAEACTTVLHAVAETASEVHGTPSTGMKMSEVKAWPRGR